MNVSGNDESYAIARAIEALQLVAADAAQQIALFPEWVVCGDEIALTVENVALFLADQPDLAVPPALREAIVMIDAAFAEMSQLREPELWSHEAIRTDVRWQRLRNRARQALADLNILRSIPAMDGVIYVPLKNSDES